MKIKFYLIRLFLFILIVLFSCSSVDYYNREYNKESELLNEYLHAYFTQTGAYEYGSKIFLKDILHPAKAPGIISDIEHFIKAIKTKQRFKQYETDDVIDTGYIDALISLLNLPDKKIAINFSQLHNIEQLNLFPPNPNRNKYNIEGYEYSFSQAGLNQDSTKLCFTSSYYCGPLCAAFTFVFMEKKDNKWIVKYEIVMMIA